MHVDEQLSDSVMRRRNERIAEPRNEEVREELAHQEIPEEPYRSGRTIRNKEGGTNCHE